MHYLLHLFILSLIQLFFKCDGILAKVDICGNTQNIDLSALDWTSWALTDIKDNNIRTDFNISVCSPLNSSDSQCNNVSHICQHNRNSNQLIGYQLKSVESVPFASESVVPSAIVVFEGPVCNENPVLNHTIRITFNCGPHLEYPQHLIDTKCLTHLFWRTSAACKQKTNQNEVKCYVYDDEGHRRDLTPLIRPQGNPHRVLSENRDLYINVCSGITGKCSEEDAGACLKTDNIKYTKVGDYRYSSIEFKRSSEVSPYNYIEMKYKTRSGSACSQIERNYTSVTTIRFICPPKTQKRNLNFIDRNPKLISMVDCEYQIEWMTEYACPQHTITANKCELTEEDHGIDFDLKSLMKSNDFYKIENISLNQTNNSSLYDIDFNVCGGLGSNYKCGDSQWNSNAVCLKSKDETKSKVIGISAGSLKLVDNRLLLEYKSSNDCKLGGTQVPESTLIEFLCDDSKGFEYKGKPEFVSFNDCVYNIVWKTSAVCPVISAKTSCVTTYKNLTFDLSPLRTGFGSTPWIASVSQILPWSKHAKDEKDTIYLNFCGSLSKFGATESCDGHSSACMTIGETNKSLNLGLFMSSPKFNEDIKAIELIYENGFDYRYNKQLTSKITLRCKPGSFDLSPTLIDIDEETGTYHFDWETWAACPINSFSGNDCKVYDSFLDYTFDLSPFRSKTPYKISTNAYDFEISICGQLNSNLCNQNTITTASGPFGICQIEKQEPKRVFSLGRMSTAITYWNGVINMTLTDGTPYNNQEKTPRKSHIAFICDPNAAHGSAPEFDGEKDRSYFFRWYTSLACPHTPKTVHCVWENSTHTIDLTPLAMTTGNHFSVAQMMTEPSIYYINVCRPLNPLHDTKMTLNGCGSDSAACKLTVGADYSALNLGVPTRPPFVGFDGTINLIYENGSVCPTNNKTRIKSLIKFECDPHSDLSHPIVHEPGHRETDGEECVYFFFWKTSAVCNAIKPTKIDTNSCVFTDPITELSVDLSGLSRTTREPHKVLVRQKQSIYELNICGQSKPFTGECIDSGVCYRSNISSQSYVSYGRLSSSSFIYDGKDLRLRYTNGSKCTAHSIGATMSSEIIFKCNPEAVPSEPRLHSSHACVSVFEWETPVVCTLRPPKCSIVSNNTYYNLRQLSSLSVGWNTTKDGTDYYLNVCRKLPKTIGCNGENSASCLCKQHICNSLGESSSEDLQVLDNGNLFLTYGNGEEDNDCNPVAKAQTQITFKCGKTTGNPKLIGFDKNQCVYKFEWSSFVACPVTNSTNDRQLPERNGYLYDQRLEIYIDIGPLLKKTFNVKERRHNENDNSTDEYTYVINLSSPELNKSNECSKAAICQTKVDGFKRDVGSIETIKYYLRGQELQIVLESNGTRKCGRNQNKRVTSIFRLQCSSRSGVGEPVFMYESDDCDYTFNWETQQLCPQNFAKVSDFEKVTEKSGTDASTVSDSPDSKPANSDNSESKSKSWIGGFIIMCFIVTLVLLFTFRQRVRQSVMFRFRRFFGPETTNHTFHYHQLASNERDKPKEEVVFISGSDAQNRNTFVAQPSGHVPYHSIYDDSDVDLLT